LFQKIQKYFRSKNVEKSFMQGKKEKWKKERTGGVMWKNE